MLAALVVALTLAQGADPLASYRGQPVLAVKFAGAPPEEVAELRGLVEIEAGYLLSAFDVQTAVKRIYALGRYADVNVYAQRSQGVITLTFAVTPIKRLARIDVVGTKGVSADALRDALLLRKGDEVDGRASERMRLRTLAFLQDEGYPNAAVETAIISPRDEVQVRMLITVQEGEPHRAKSVRFSGEPRAPWYALLDLVATRPGSIVRAKTLAEDRERLADAFRERGFLRAVVGEPELFDGPEGTEVVFPVRAGERIAIDFSGNTVFDDATLRKLLPDTNEPLREREIRDLAERVVEHYRKLGRFATTAVVRGFTDRDNGIVRYVIVVEEGAPVRVADIRFPGATAFEEELLVAQVRAVLERGEAQEGLFEPLSRNKQCLANAADEGVRRDVVACPEAETPPADRWVPDLYQQALDEITGVYNNLGFLSAQVGPAQAAFDGDVVHVTVPVTEGIQTFVRTIGYSGNDAVSAPDLLSLAEETTSNREVQAPLRPGAPFSSTGIEDARIAAVRSYRDKGYVYARVFADVSLSPDRQWADVTYRFEEGPQVRIGRVLVRGNRYTREGVIRSRITLKPGDVYRLEQALGDQRAIGALGVFSSVRVKLIDEEKPAETKDLIADVVERDRQPVEISPGLSTADGPRLLVSYSHINVFGTASTATISAKVNRQIFFDLYGQYDDLMRDRYKQFSTLQQIERELRAGIHSPRIIAWPLTPSFRLDLVQERTNVISYSLDSTALIFGIDTYPGKRWTVSLEPQISYTDLQCPSQADCVGDVQSLRPDRLRLDRGTRRTFKVGPSITYDRRDNAFNPTRGFYGNVKAYYAIGDLRTSEIPAPVRLVTVQGTATAYFPIWKLVLALSARGGIIGNIGQAIPIDERFFLGGRDTLRGYVERTLIPQDVCVVSDGSAASLRCKSTVIRAPGSPPISPGGETFVLFKTELRVPLSERVSVGLFLDAGNLWFAKPEWNDLQLRYGTGAGLRYSTPVGALALDFGVNPDRRAQNAEARAQVHFSVGVF